MSIFFLGGGLSNDRKQNVCTGIYSNIQTLLVGNTKYMEYDYGSYMYVCRMHIKLTHFDLKREKIHMLYKALLRLF